MIPPLLLQLAPILCQILAQTPRGMSKTGKAGWFFIGWWLVMIVMQLVIPKDFYDDHPRIGLFCGAFFALMAFLTIPLVVYRSAYYY